MKGFLVVNHFLNGEKYDKLHSHLISSSKNLNIDLKLRTNLQLACEDKFDADFVLFWDKDVNLAKRLEIMGVPVFNSARAIELCDDKAKTYLSLLNKLPQPKTLISPLSFFNDNMSEFVKNAIDLLGLPLVFKECFGSFGAQVFLCESADEIMAHISHKPFILQEFIKESVGRDKRLEVVGDKVASCVRRENKNDFRSNVTNGGTMTPCQPTDREKELAVNACKILGLDFGGIDILDGEIICEVNSNAHIINIMESTGVDIAPLIFEYIMEKIK